ncbi:MAG: FtsW/RodA/SpoVE family cell cycle protein, partial [Chloroflexota bacterium]
MELRIWRNFDFILVGIALLIITYGIVMIYSATQSTVDLQLLWRTQLIRVGFGLVAMMIVAAIDYRYYTQVYHLLYLLIVGLLVVLLLVGELTGGTQRWLAGGAIQPGELTKLIIIICLAKFLSDNDGEMDRIRPLAISIILTAIPILLIFLQPDLGTSIIVGFIWFVMALMAGMRLFHVGLMASGLLLASPIIWLSLRGYMRQRITLFLNPASSPDDYYNVQQALISIGSGGWLGKGFGAGTQNQLRFLRVRHTDFLFSVIGEELGMLGAAVLFLLIVLLLWRILRAANLAGDAFGRQMCIGVAAVIFFQSAVNIGVNLGVMPVTGTPLPFVSYGGSSLLTFLLALGLVQSVLL